MRVISFDDEDMDDEEQRELDGADALCYSGPIGEEAMSEIAQWLGFGDTDAYLTALPIERERIFDRARD